ncbi:potassium transporter TrkG (plasmid) [Rossellomorea sp. AcN35-11]|nr:ATPase [Rossellomorea aquimaris]WJV32123.1 potassium transporter TrkG [Rossellomorea sp. AcN35-11]
MYKTSNRMSPLKPILMIYTLGILFFTFMFMQPFANESGIGFIDALFLSASGMSVTGLSTIDITKELSVWGQLLLMVEFQVGGIGIMAFYTYVLFFVGRDFSISQLLVVSADQNQRNIKSIRKVAILILLIVIVVEFLGFLFLYPIISKENGTGMDSVFMATFHTVSSFTGAGFDLFGNSLMGFQENPIFLLISSVLIILGVLGFPVILDLLNVKKRKKTLFTKVNLFVHGVLLVFGFILFLFSEWSRTFGELNVFDKMVNAWFLSVTSRNGGLTSIDIGSVQVGTLMVLGVLMFIGASSSSCGGGIRTSTFAVLISKLWAIARGKGEATLFKKTIPNETVERSFLIFFGFLGVFIFSVVLISFVEPFGIDKIAFEILSALTTTGLSTGVTDQLSSFTKVWMSLLMLVGRVGIIVWVYLFISEKKTKTKYIKEDIAVG